MSGIETLFMRGNGTLSWTAGPAKITGDNAGGLAIISAANKGISISAGSSIFFDTADNNVMTITAGGSVGIGTNEPNRLFHANGPVSLGEPFNTPSATNQGYLDTMHQFRSRYGIALQWNNDVTVDTWWAIYPGGTNEASNLNFSNSIGSGGDQHNLAGRGYIAHTRAYTAITFTGQHRNLMNTSIGVSQEGLIVSATNNIINLDNSIVPTINDTLPYCVITNTDNDKKVFGIISTKEDNEKTREYGSGNFVSILEKENINEERIFVNSVGEGAIWVANKNGTLEIGDYISSTTITGYGGKQADGLLHNYTVGKMTGDCDFSLTKIVKQKLKVIQTSEGQELVYDSSGNPEYEDDLDSGGNVQMVYQYDTRFLQADGTLLVDEADYLARLAISEAVYIACFVGCTYHCG